jgi:hypothetical protein
MARIRTTAGASRLPSGEPVEGGRLALYLRHPLGPEPSSKGSIDLLDVV